MGPVCSLRVSVTARLYRLARNTTPEEAHGHTHTRASHTRTRARARARIPKIMSERGIDMYERP